MASTDWALVANFLGFAFLAVGVGITVAYRQVLPYVRGEEGLPSSPPEMLVRIFGNFMKGAYGCFAAGIVLLVVGNAVLPSPLAVAAPGAVRIPISLWYGGALGILLVILTYNVLRHRVRSTIAAPGETDPTAERIARVHANFTEYAPLGLGLLIALELSGAPALVVHVGGAVFTAARYLHAYGYTTNEFASFGRIVGIQSTLLGLSYMVGASLYYFVVA
jgi:uncharacterized membrane protein YecN with MAPEG domain